MIAKLESNKILKLILVPYDHNINIMQRIELVSCQAKRPDKRAIANMINDIAQDMDFGLAAEMTDILLEGDPVEIMVDAKNTSSAYRAIRKLDIDYELLE